MKPYDRGRVVTQSAPTRLMCVTINLLRRSFNMNNITHRCPAGLHLQFVIVLVLRVNK